ncbi:ribosome silencing factor [uncultured Gilvimarinus sp.]|uniref:ribosome silencing factor n=1 Tax=uncultured Gilvimarinus sp. TaxID=1689143 RepID=UPI0030EDDADF|tara:strand:+ start:12 stop:353 length:342 start_codon:yes stop_codon:yes gene_type:complete
MSDSINTLILNALDDLKARDVTEVDVRDKSDVMDTMIIATGTSNRHIRSMAVHVIEESKKANLAPLGAEGLEGSDWVLVDYGDTVLHVMLPEAREFYDLEKLWSVSPANRTED